MNNMKEIQIFPNPFTTGEQISLRKSREGLGPLQSPTGVSKLPTELQLELIRKELKELRKVDFPQLQKGTGTGI